MKQALVKETAQFWREQEALNSARDQAADPKERELLELRTKIEKAEHEAVTKKVEAEVAAQEKGKSSSEAVKAECAAKDASKAYQAAKDEWHKKAVRDEAYKPMDAESGKKVDALRKEEELRWSQLESRCKRDSLDQNKVRKERDRIQRDLDAKLEKAFPMQHGYGHSM
jgi:hypothetical protein